MRRKSTRTHQRRIVRHFLRYTLPALVFIDKGNRINPTKSMEPVVNPPQLRYLRRNFTLFYCDYVIFATAFAMIGASTVVPDFVKRITDNPLLIGLAGVMYNFSWLLPQLLFSQVVNRSTNRMAIMSRVVVPFRL